MPKCAIVYGDIIERQHKAAIAGRNPEGNPLLDWRDESSPTHSVQESSVVFVDLDNPAFASTDFLLSLATAGKDVKVVGKLQDPDIKEVMRVSKLGVTEILTPEQCLQRLNTMLDSLAEEKTAGESKRSQKYSVDTLIGKSRQTEKIRKSISTLCGVDFPSALILGETGTGKSLICKILHHAGMRSNHNLVEVNCSAIPDDLFESELFGHVKGAFTDAKSEKTGLFEYAQNGTLFLDEVGNLSGAAQAKLLKAIEDKKLRKIGNLQEKDINVRVVAATNMNLKKAIKIGSFREDLFYRLNLLTIEIPPLRERPEDIPYLVNFYLDYYSRIYSKDGMTISDEALELLKSYNWPGNIRELCNVLERTTLLSKSNTINKKHISPALGKGRVTAAERQQFIVDIPPQGITLQQIEQSIVKQVLDMLNWNKTEAAKYLGISRPRLRRILDDSGLDRNRRKR